MRVLSWLLFLGLLCGCGDAGPAVPFRLDEATEHTDNEPPVSAGDPVEEDIVWATPRLTPNASNRLQLQGETLEANAIIRASFEHNFGDARGQEALLVLQSDETLALAYATRNETGWHTPEIIAEGQLTRSDWQLSTVSASQLDDGRWVMHTELTSHVPDMSIRSDHWILSYNDPPQLEQQITRWSGMALESLTLTSNDIDNDGHPDVRCALHFQDNIPDLHFDFFDRPNGLMSARSEPEPTLERLSRRALRRLQRNPRRALRESRVVLQMHANLCREVSPTSAFGIGGRRGLACGESEGAGRAAATAARAAAALGDLSEALAMQATLATPGFASNNERSEAVQQAIASAPHTPGATFFDGPRVRRVSWNAGSRRSMLGFLDEAHLLIRQTPPQIMRIRPASTPSSDPIEIPEDTEPETAPTTDAQPSRWYLQPLQEESALIDLRHRDPSGRFGIQRIERACDVAQLRIVPLSGLVRGTSLGSAIATPTLTSPSEDTALCAEAGIDESERYDILGWAPQGIVLYGPLGLQLISLDAEAHTNRPPVVLDRQLPPAPLTPGIASADGRFFIHLEGPAITRHRLGQTSSTTLIWPEGWGVLEGDASDAAVSPSGQRIAVIRDGLIRIIELAGR